MSADPADGPHLRDIELGYVRDPEAELPDGAGVARLINLLGPYIDPDEAFLSDSEWVYRIKKRFDLAWNKKQALIDPNE